MSWPEVLVVFFRLKWEYENVKVKFISILAACLFLLSQYGVASAQDNSNPLGFLQNIVCSFTGWWCPQSGDTDRVQPEQHQDIPGSGQIPTSSNIGNFINLANIFSPSGVGRLFSSFVSLFNRNGSSGSGLGSGGLPGKLPTTVGEDEESEGGSNIGSLGELEMLCTGSITDINYCNDLFEGCSTAADGCSNLDQMCNSSQANLDYCKSRGYTPKSGSVAVPTPKPVTNPTIAPAAGSGVIPACVGISISNQSALSGCIAYCSGANEASCLDRIRLCRNGRVSGGDCSSFANAASACCGFIKLPDCSKLTTEARNALCLGR